MEDKKNLPQRSTRGKRLRAQLEDEEDQADQEFWNQEFFAEDAGDADYVSEKEEEDVPDSDFFESESEADEDEEVEVRERKKKTLKPPGAPPGSSKPRVPKPPAAPKPPKPPASSSPSTAIPDIPQSVLFEATYEAPTLRKSTRARVEVAQKEREEREQLAKTTRRPQRPGAEVRVMTQEELLAEAARTELDNLASLKALLAREEETKKKANVKKQRFGGPLIRFRSRGIDVLVPPEVLAQQKQWEQQQQQHTAPQPSASTAGATSSNPLGAAADAAAEPSSAAAAAAGDAGNGADKAAAEPMQVDQQPAVKQEQQQDQQQEQKQPVQQQQQQEQQQQGPGLQRQLLNTLQCLGMKAPKWLLPQRAPPPPAKALCAITGAPAKYRDPLTGHYYSSVDAFRELRRRLGQPLPQPEPSHRLAASPALELLAGAGAGAAADGVASAGGLPPGQSQLQQLVQHQVEQELAVASSKGKGRSQMYYQQEHTPDEVAALVVQVAQLAHVGH